MLPYTFCRDLPGRLYYYVRATGGEEEESADRPDQNTQIPGLGYSCSSIAGQVVYSVLPIFYSFLNDSKILIPSALIHRYMPLRLLIPALFSLPSGRGLGGLIRCTGSDCLIRYSTIVGEKLL